MEIRSLGAGRPRRFRLCGKIVRPSFAHGAVAALLGAALLGAQEPAAISSLVVGGRFSYTTRPGDSLTRIGAQFGAPVAALARDNGLPPTARLRVGQPLQVDNRHIVPKTREDGILINVPQRMLYLFAAGQVAAHHPVGLGRPTWRTPLGDFRVQSKRRTPVWHVPPSIQEEMRQKGQEVKTEVPPGPDNPLGEYWLGLDRFDCGIHGTNAPASVYQFRTHGCIRAQPEAIAALFPHVAVGTPVEIIYEPVLVARTADGAIFLEVHPDVYRMGTDPRRVVEAAAAAPGVGARLDGKRAEQVIREREGLAREVTRPPG
jgi:L,D-transpeptidase ErfK/SrfK